MKKGEGRTETKIEKSSSVLDMGHWMLPRRELLKRMAGGLVAGTLGTKWLNLAAQENSEANLENESFWEQIKRQFPIRPSLIMMNSANLCPTHYGVLETLFGLTRNLEGDVSFQNRAKFREEKTNARSLLAQYVGADPEEIAITRNTSEGNNIVVNGLELGEGDEVVIWDENHPSNHAAWDVRARRQGFSVKKIPTPEGPITPESLRQHFIGTLTPNTRIFAASHVSNVSGLTLPIKALCLECRSLGILTLIDGAQSLGALSLNLHDMACDFYTGSLHKWPMGPKETGLLYVRRGLAERVWPSLVSVGYEAAETQGAQKFETLGQRSDPTIAAIGPAIEFHNTINKEIIEARLRFIVQRLRNGISLIPGASILTPPDPSMSAGVLVFSLPGIGGREVFEALYHGYDIAAAPAGINNGVRLSPHIFNTLSDIESVILSLTEIAVGELRGSRP